MPNPRSEWRVRKLRAFCAERDGWRCHRCGGQIDRHVRYPHPMSLTLEHTIEMHTLLRLGLDPYDAAHCAVSHRRCNLSAGATFGNRLRAQGARSAYTW